MYFLVDSDAAIGNNKDTSKASDTSLRKLDTIDGTKEKYMDYALMLEEKELWKVFLRSYH